MFGNVFLKQLINQNLDQQKFKTCAVRVETCRSELVISHLGCES